MATWLSVGCTSTPPKTTINPTLGRADLYDGHSTIAISQNQPPQNEQQALGQAKQAESLQKFDKAIYSYIQALEFSPDNAETLYHIAQIHSLRGNREIAFKYDKAIELFQRAIVTTPSYFEQANKNLKRAMLSYREQVQLKTIKLGS